MPIPKERIVNQVEHTRGALASALNTFRIPLPLLGDVECERYEENKEDEKCDAEIFDPFLDFPCFFGVHIFTMK